MKWRNNVLNGLRLVGQQARFHLFQLAEDTSLGDDVPVEDAGIVSGVLRHRFSRLLVVNLRQAPIVHVRYLQHIPMMGLQRVRPCGAMIMKSLALDSFRHGSPV